MSFNHTCEICQSSFTSVQPHTTVCGRRCFNQKVKNNSGRGVIGEKISNGTVGAMSELFVAGDLMRRGYSVFRALSPHCYCDLIAMKEGVTMAVEVRTGYMSKYGTYTFPKTIHKNANCFGVYERNSGQVTYFDTSFKQITL